MTVTTLLDALSRASRSERGVHFLDRREKSVFLSYAQLHERARAVAAGLRAQGVRPRDRVGIIMPTDPGYYDAFFGTLLAGATPVPLYPPVRLGRLGEYHESTARMLDMVGAQLLLSTSTIRRLLGRTLERTRVPFGCKTIQDMPRVTEAPGDAGGAEVHGTDVALIQFSSGTTAAPKPVALTHEQILANINAIRSTITESYPDTPELPNAAVCWLPLYHDMGLIGCLLTCLVHAADLTLLPPELFVAKPAAWLRAISEHRGTVSPAPSFAYAYCAERIRDEEIEGIDLSCWRLALNGAEPISARAQRAFSERFSRVGFRQEALTPVYGLAEAALALTFSNPLETFVSHRFNEADLQRGFARPDANGAELVSVGRPLHGFEVRIVDEAGSALEEGRMGRIVARGPSIAREAGQGIHNLVEGWLDTGDRGFRFDGELFVYGRTKELVIIRGRNYAPQRIESIVEEVPGVRHGCSVALGVRKVEGEQLVLLVERERRADSKDDGALGRAVEQRVLEYLGLHAAKVVVLEPGVLPRTSSGKLRRAEALLRFESGHLEPPRPANWPRLAFEMIRSGVGYWRARRAPPSQRSSR